MDDIKFIKEAKRMCDSFNSCYECPASDSLGRCKFRLSHEYSTKELSIVEEWAKDHPAKTRQSVFLEQYPEACIDEADGVLRMCPAMVSMAHRGDEGICADIYKDCDVCRREFWMQEVE